MTPAKTAAGPSLLDKFAALDKAMRSKLIESEEDIEIFKLALLAREHAFWLGVPGIAKSYLVDVGMSLIDGLTSNDYFYILFMKSTSREDVFGPLDLPGLKNGHYRFLTDGYLPAAKIAFGDEFWKGNAAIQNALLLATNERKFKNDGVMYDIPLHTMFIASNEMPESDELRAIYDRMLFRKTKKEVSEPGNFINMLKLGIGVPTTIAPVLTWDDVEAAHNEVLQVVISNAVLEALAEIREKLKGEEIFPSPRRFKNSLKAVQAAAWLDGEAEADIEHLRPLRHILWDQPEDFPTVEKLLLELANPLDKEIMSIMGDVEKISSTMEKAIADNLDEDMKQRTGGQIYEKLKHAQADLAKISDQMKGSKRRSAKFEDAAGQIKRITTRMLVKLFDMNEEEIDQSQMDPNQ